MSHKLTATTAPPTVRLDAVFLSQADEHVDDLRVGLKCKQIVSLSLEVLIYTFEIKKDAHGAERP